MTKKTYWTVYQIFNSKAEADDYISFGGECSVYFDDSIKEDNLYFKGKNH